MRRSVQARSGKMNAENGKSSVPRLLLDFFYLKPDHSPYVYIFSQTG
jgi:hypothetical protein